MGQKEIVDYVMNSPANTNPNVLKTMLSDTDESGSSDFSVARVTLVNGEHATITDLVPLQLPLLIPGQETAEDYGAYSCAYGQLQPNLAYDIILYKGQCLTMCLGGNGYEPQDISVNGNVKRIDQSGIVLLMITGDCTINWPLPSSTPK